MTAARFRVASGLTGDNLDAGSATRTVLDGEVEDYVVNLVSLHTISGTVYADEENDDTFSDGDAPIEGVTITLFADDGNGEPDGTAIAPIEYNNTEVTVNDGLVDSNTAIATISLDFKPFIDLDSDNSASI